MAYHDVTDYEGPGAQVSRTIELDPQKSMFRSPRLDDWIVQGTHRVRDAASAKAHASILHPSARIGSASVENSLLHLQRQYGNHYVGQVLRQATSGRAAGGDGDSIERRPLGGIIQREEASSLQTAEAKSGEIISATAPVPAADAVGFSGSSIKVDSQTAAAVREVTGTDVSGARFHDNPRANELAKSMGSIAVTAGRDIAVAGSNDINKPGNKVLAHELAHVAQQGGAKAGASQDSNTGEQGASEIGAPNTSAEAEADIVAAQATAASENVGIPAVVGTRTVAHLPSGKLSLHGQEHLQSPRGKRVLRGWNTDQTLSETLDLWPTNLNVKMKVPPNIVKSSYAGGWEPKVYFNHEWSYGGKGRFLLGGVEHGGWDDGNSWTTLASVPNEKLAMPVDDYAPAKTQAEAQMTDRPDFHWNSQTVSVSSPVNTYKTAFQNAPTVTAEGNANDSANRAPFGASDFMASSQTARSYTVSYTQTVAKSVADSATSTFGHTTSYQDETSVGLKGTATKGEDKTGKIGVEASFGKKWTNTETASAQRAMGATYSEMTQSANSFSIVFPIPAGVPAAVLVVPVTKKVTSKFSMRGAMTDGGVILNNEDPPASKVLEANVPKGMMAIYGYDITYATALEKHYTECLDLFKTGKALPATKQEPAKKALQQKIDLFSKENQPSFKRAIEDAEETLKETPPAVGQKTTNSGAISGDNILRYHKKIDQIYEWATS